MILRHLSRSVRKQNWFDVVLEIVIVVVGIFIALQVDSWNSERKERALENQYLTRLHADMVGTLEDQHANDGWDRRQIDAQEIVLRSLRSGELKDQDRDLFGRGLMFLGAINPRGLRWSTVEELKSTGNLTILQSIELRELIGAVETSYQRWSQIIAGEEMVLTAHKIELQKRFEATAYGLNYSEPTEIHYDFEELVTDRELLNIISNAHARSVLINEMRQQHVQEVEMLRDELARLLASDKDQSR